MVSNCCGFIVVVHRSHSLYILKSRISHRNGIDCFSLVHFLGDVLRVIFCKKQIGLSLRLYGLKVVLPITIVTILSVILPGIIHYNLSEGWTRLILSTVISCLIVAILIYTIGLTATERNFIITGIVSRIKRTFHQAD